MPLTLDHALPSGRMLRQIAAACEDTDEYGNETEAVDITGTDLTALLDLANADGDEINSILRGVAANAGNREVNVDAADLQGVIEEGIVSSIVADETVRAELPDRVAAALDIALSMGWNDGSHHKQHALDQIVRALAGDDGYALLMATNPGWDEGIPS